MAALPEPARSAFALFYSLARESGAGSEAHCALLADWLGLKPEAFAEALAQARLALSSKGAGQAVVEEAGKTAEPELATAQTAFERQWHREVEAIEFPSGLTLPDLAGPSSPRLRSLLRQPAVLAIGVALLVVLGVVFFAAVRKIDDFPGKELVAEMIEEPGAFDASKMEKIEAAEAGSLGDWFLLKGFDNFSVPPELEHARTVACRVYKYEGHPVAQLALSRQDALLLVFHCTEMKVPLDSLQWYIYQQDDWAVATRGDGKNCYVVAFVGNSDDMGALLHKMAQSEGKSPGAQEANESAPPGNGK